MGYSVEELEFAFKKLKSYFYYDSENILIKENIALFEKDIEKKLINLSENLNRINIEQFETIDLFKDKYFKRLFDEIKYDILPRKIKIENEIEESNIISNQLNDIKVFEFEKVRILINAPIEIHIISILWAIENKFLFSSKDLYAYTMYQDCTKGNNLFLPYYKQYQKWRDNGIELAKKEIQNDSNALIILIDIKNYYDSVIIDFRNLDNNLNTYILKFVHIKYYEVRKKCKFNKIQNEVQYLPIGLISSGILANYFLVDLDKELKNRSNSKYYGRYVDDIMIVVQNNQIKKEHLNIDNILYRLFNNLFIKKNNNQTFVLSKKISNKFDYTNIEFCKEKMKVIFLDYKNPMAILKKIEKEIKVCSSEYRYLPDVKYLESEFENEAFSSNYTGSKNILRNLDYVRYDKHRISTYLAKLIYYISVRDIDKDFLKEDAQQILKLFKGEVLITYFSLWEKVITFFYINNLKGEFYVFINQILDILSKCKNEKDEESSLIIKTLRRYLNIVIMVVFSLDIQRAYNFIRKSKISRLINIENIMYYRKANIFNHKLIVYPLLNYIEFILFSEKYSLIDKNVLNYIESENIKHFKMDKIFTKNNKLIKFSPRFIHFHEFQLFEFYCSGLSNLKKIGYDKLSVVYNSMYNDSVEILNKLVVKVEFDYYKELNFGYKNKKCNKIKIGIANIDIKFDENIEKNVVYRDSNTSCDRFKEIRNILKLAVKEKNDIVVFPELTIPYCWLSILVEYSKNNQLAMVFGLEHVLKNDYAYNYLVTLLPYKDSKKHKAVFIDIRLKKHYSPEEIRFIEGYNYNVPSEKEIQRIYIWRNLYFTCFNCFELTDINDRAIFKSQVDLIIASECNRDIKYFSNIVESVSRDIHCYVAQVNNSIWGDSRITRPSKTIFKDVVRIKGGENSILITGSIDINELRKFQLKSYELQKDNNLFKPTPPGFNKDNVKKRLGLI